MRIQSTLSFSLLTALVVVAVLPAAMPANAADEPQPGRIAERVVCKNSSEQTYALYLPSNYSPTRNWPLIAAFDPGARGSLPVERFKEAAERYGFIVCGSNNSRNGSMRQSADAAQAMLVDVTARFAIDDKRVYLTGFSGGARAATAIAVWLSGKIAGVIGCGAGFAEGVNPSTSFGFVYYGTVGTEDFNYPEMKRLDRVLDQARIAHHVEVFEGGHDWASSDACVRAVEWIELQAMKSGRRARDDLFIDRLFGSAQENASRSESAGDAYEAYLTYAGTAADFKDLRDTAEVEKKLASLKDSKAVKQALSRDRDQEAEQGRRLKEIFTLRAKLRSQTLNAELGEGNPETTAPQPYNNADEPLTRQSIVGDLRRILSELKRKSDAKEKSPERSLARRVLNQFLVSSFEQSRMLVMTKKYDLAAANLATDAEVMPDNWRIWYNLACAYALGGNKRRAIDSLSKAVEKGLTNAAALESDSQLDSIRDEPGFKKIADAIKQRQ
jgi:predicted esterase